MRNGAYLYRYAPFTVLRLSIKFPAVTALPKGEPRVCSPCWHEKWSVSMPIRSIHCFTTVHQATFGDGSPKGRAKGFCPVTKQSVSIPIRSIRCFTTVHQVACGDSSPKGRARGLFPHVGMRNGAYLCRYAPFTVLRLSIKSPTVTALSKGEPRGLPRYETERIYADTLHSLFYDCPSSRPR